MYKVDDILEVVRKPLGVDLYPGMIVQVVKVEFISQAVGLAFMNPEDIVPYNVKLCVKYPLTVLNGYGVAENIDASVFKPNKDISPSDFHFNTKYYSNLNTTIYDREKMRYVFMGEPKDPDSLKKISSYALRRELTDRGFKVIRDDEVVDMSNGPKKIIFNYPATICFWPDGTKTVVKCVEGQEFSEYYGYLACLAKKLYGTNGEINRIINRTKEYGDGHEGEVKKVDGAQVGQLLNAAVKVEQLQAELKVSKATAATLRNSLNSFYERFSKFIRKAPITHSSKKVLIGYAKKTFPEIFED